MSKNIGSEKDHYRSQMENAVVPIFFQPWWLDIVTKKRWEVIYYQESNVIQAVYTYYPKKKFGLGYVTMPQLTRFMGAYFLLDISHRKKQKILGKLLQALPIFDGFEQTLHYQITDWLPYSWAGFAQTSKYSFVLKNISDTDRIREGMTADYRNNKLPKSNELLSFVEGQDMEDAMACFEAPFGRKKMAIPYRVIDTQRLIEALIERGSGNIFGMQDGDGTIVANALVAWDDSSAYLLMRGENAEKRNGYAGIGLIWNLCEYLAERGINTFDFLGSMDKSIAKVRSDFGANQTVYFHVRKDKPMFSIMKKLGRK